LLGGSILGGELHSATFPSNAPVVVDVVHLAVGLVSNGETAPGVIEDLVEDGHANHHEHQGYQGKDAPLGHFLVIAS
jgi:hypothetical protein